MRYATNEGYSYDQEVREAWIDGDDALEVGNLLLAEGNVKSLEVS